MRSRIRDLVCGDMGEILAIPAQWSNHLLGALQSGGEPIHLVMEAMDSKHFAEPYCAAEYSSDGRNWEEIPDTIEVRGSRYALVIGSLRREETSLPLNQTRVPVGPSTGRHGNRYVCGRVDKACLEVLGESNCINQAEAVERPISLVAELTPPYAVFLRNYR